jgi:hypothetical protein
LALDAQEFWCNGRGYDIVRASSFTFDDAIGNSALFKSGTDFGYLATITTSEELTCLQSKLPAWNFWIGGSDFYSEGTYRWIDGPEAGQTVSNQFWFSGQPGGGRNENCLVLNSGKFHDFPCDSKLYFLTEYSKDGIDACTVFLFYFY